MSSPKPLVVDHLTKRYGNERGVHDVTFSLDEGEVFGFLGPNGAGKTTTIRATMNFIRPSSGEVRIFGLDSVRDSVAAKKHIGYLAGDLAIYPELTGHKFLEYMAALQGGVDWDDVSELTSRFEADLSRPMSHLSKGNRQKIGIIQAFMHRPDLLILDEPTSGLDPLMQEEFYALIRDRRDNGATIFISSHNLGEVQKICDRAAFIRQGKLVSVEQIKQLEKMSVHHFTVWFDQKVTRQDFAGVKGVEQMTFADHQAHFVVSGSVDAFIKALARFKVQNIEPQETELEDMFMRFYKGGAK